MCQSGTADARLRHPAARAAPVRALPGGAPRAHGPRYHEHQVVAPADPGLGRDGGRGPAARHADDREGARLSERDAGRSGGRGHGTLPPGLPVRRADVSAAGAGGGAHWAGAQGRARGGADAASVAPCAGLGGEARHRGVPPGGARPARGPAVSTGDGAGQSAGDGNLGAGGGTARRRAVGLVRGAGGEVPPARDAARAGALSSRGSRTAGAGTCCSRGRRRRSAGSSATRRRG
jgi:hypothetical protein